MALLGKVLAIIIIGTLLFTIFYSFIWIILILVISYFVIRFLADIFWWGRDNGKW